MNNKSYKKQKIWPVYSYNEVCDEFDCTCEPKSIQGLFTSEEKAHTFADKWNYEVGYPIILDEEPH